MNDIASGTSVPMLHEGEWYGTMDLGAHYPALTRSWPNRFPFLDWANGCVDDDMNEPEVWAPMLHDIYTTSDHIEY